MSTTLKIRGYRKVEIPALPEGYRAVIMLPYAHSDGHGYGHRVFAVRTVAHFRLPEWGGEPGKMKVFLAGTKPVVYSWLDCNDEYEFLLPRRSLEFVGGLWVNRRRAKYRY